MLEAMSCWAVNWTDIGAVLTGVGAIAPFAVGVALWVGLEPRRLQKDALHRKSVVAHALLLQKLPRKPPGKDKSLRAFLL